jgi:hypothetical protein
MLSPDHHIPSYSPAGGLKVAQEEEVANLRVGKLSRRGFL